MRPILALLTPRTILHRLRILKLAFFDHQFERTSPLPAVPDNILDAIYSHEVLLPPRKHLELAGGQTLEGLIFLASLAKALRAKQLFEFGTFKGVTTWTLARNAEGSVVYTLDLPAEVKPSLPLEGTDEVVRSMLGDHLYAQLPHDSEVRQLWGDSAAFDASQLGCNYDLVYVDGAHSEPYVRLDTENALSMVAPAGVIVWDDYWRDVKGVRSVLHTMQGHPLYRVPKTRLVVRLTPDSLQRMKSGSPHLWQR